MASSVTVFELPSGNMPFGWKSLGFDVAGKVYGVTGVFEFDGDGDGVQCRVGRAELMRNRLAATASGSPADSAADAARSAAIHAASPSPILASIAATAW